MNLTQKNIANQPSVVLTAERPLSLPRISQKTELFIVAVAALFVGAFFGLSYGIDNQTTYLLRGLRLLNPDFLRADWLASTTYHYHPTFAIITRFLGSFGRVPWNFALGNLVVIAAALLVLYALMVYINKQTALVTTLFLYAFVLLERTDSIGGSYLFDHVLQPSTLASLGLVTALAFFLMGRYGFSGLFLGLSGLAHVNYLLLGFLFMGSAHLLLGKTSLIKRGLQQFALSLGVLALFVPDLLAMANSANVAAARFVFQEIRSPHHYIPATYTNDFLLFVGWQLIAWACLPLLSRKFALNRRFGALYISFVGLLAFAVLLTLVLYVPFVSQLFLWRMAPFAVLLAQIVIAVRLAEWLYEPSAVRAWATPFWRPLLALAGVGLVIGANQLWPSDLVAVAATAVALILLTLFFTLLARPDSKLTGLVQRLPVFILPLLVLFMVIALQAGRTVESSNLLNGYPGADYRALYEWAKSTDEEAQFLIPPRLEDFRLQSERAVLADWKSTPILPDELLEWYRRMGAVSGEPEVRTAKEAEAGYEQMDAQRLSQLVEEFQLDYAVFRQPMDTARFDAPVVFSNDKFIVFALQSE